MLILAGAGTGKTRTVTSRICHMLKKKIPAESILAVTFTNKAANEMRERVVEMAGQRRSEGLTLCTFHSLCVRILRADIEALELGYRNRFAICTADDQSGILKKLIVQKSGPDENLDAYAAASLISQSRNRGEEEVDPDDPGSLLAEVARAYREELRQLNALDFDDLLVLGARVLAQCPEVRERWSRRFNYIMVDEFQDTNSLQMDLLRHLASHGNVCVVGDDDQSIYGWRGADVTNILDFERFFSDPFVVRLEENYRSTNTILETANGLIRHNADRREKQLWSGLGQGDPIRLIVFPDDNAETEMVAREIWSAQREQGRKWEDFAILFRTNGQSRALESKLRELDIPYRLVGGRSFFDKREVRDALAYLGAITDPDDDLSVLRIVNNPPRGISNKTVQVAMEVARARGLSLVETFAEREFTSLITSRAAGAVADFRQFLFRLHALAESPENDLRELLKYVLGESGYTEYMARMCKTPDEANMRRENLHELGLSMEWHQKNVKSKKRRGLRGFLDAVALGDKKDDDKDKDKSGVTLITLHASKGLEFPVVYLVGLEEGILPHRRSIEEGTRDEERRLLYVGITRAERQLTLSYCQCRRKWGDLMPCMPSSFIAELDPENLLEVDYAEEQRKPVSVDEAAGLFDQMRAMLEDED